MEVIDFLNIRGQQKFEKKNLNSIEIRIKNDRVQIFWKNIRKTQPDSGSKDFYFKQNNQRNR